MFSLSLFPLYFRLKEVSETDRQAGVHMVANFLLEHFDNEFVNIMCLKGLDFNLDGNMSQFYL